MTELGTVVLRLRKSKKLSRAQVEYKTGGEIKNSWLAHFEANRIKHPGPVKMRAIASALDTTTFAIYKEAGVIEAESPEGVDDAEVELIATFRKLPPNEQPTALRIMHDLASAHETSEDKPHHGKKKKAA